MPTHEALYLILPATLQRAPVPPYHTGFKINDDDGVHKPKITGMGARITACLGRYSRWFQQEVPRLCPNQAGEHSRPRQKNSPQPYVRPIAVTRLLLVVLLLLLRHVHQAQNRPKR